VADEHLVFTAIKIPTGSWRYQSKECSFCLFCEAAAQREEESEEEERNIGETGLALFHVHEEILPHHRREKSPTSLLLAAAL
jgi:MinD superfamily P-loop ATPase